MTDLKDKGKKDESNKKTESDKKDESNEKAKSNGKVKRKSFLNIEKYREYFNIEVISKICLTLMVFLLVLSWSLFIYAIIAIRYNWNEITAIIGLIIVGVLSLIMTICFHYVLTSKIIAGIKSLIEDVTAELPLWIKKVFILIIFMYFGYVIYGFYSNVPLSKTFDFNISDIIKNISIFGTVILTLCNLLIIDTPDFRIMVFGKNNMMGKRGEVKPNKNIVSVVGTNQGDKTVSYKMLGVCYSEEIPTILENGKFKSKMKQPKIYINNKLEKNHFDEIKKGCMSSVYKLKFQEIPPKFCIVFLELPSHLIFQNVVIKSEKHEEDKRKSKSKSKVMEWIARISLFLGLLILVVTSIIYLPQNNTVAVNNIKYVVKSKNNFRFNNYSDKAANIYIKPDKGYIYEGEYDKNRFIICKADFWVKSGSPIIMTSTHCIIKFKNNSTKTVELQGLQSALNKDNFVKENVYFILKSDYKLSSIHKMKFCISTSKKEASNISIISKNR